MSRYTFLASLNPLPEIDHSGFIRLKVKDLKKMNDAPHPNSPISWEKLDDETEVLYAASEDDIGGLKISLCNHPPADWSVILVESLCIWWRAIISALNSIGRLQILTRICKPPFYLVRK